MRSILNQIIKIYLVNLRFKKNKIYSNKPKF